MIDRDALVKRLQFTIDDGTLRERGGGCRTATDHEIALWNILAAPAEAPVAESRQHAPRTERASFTVKHEGKDVQVVHATTCACIEREANSLREQPPLPQSAPVSREAVIEECAKVCDGEASRYAQLGMVSLEDTARRAAAAIRALPLAAHPAEPAKETGMKVTDEMINRFLSWRLPDDFCPDCFISFDRSSAEKYRHRSWPIGTNLLTADQARKMLEHVLGADHTAEPAGKGG